MPVQLDAIDSKILELLQRDSRMQYKDIAKEVGVSPPTVRSRIKRLTDLGVIKKFTIILDSQRLWGRVSCFLLARVDSKDPHNLAEQANLMKQVTAAYLVAGEKQLLLQIELDDLTQLPQFIADAERKLNIANISSLVVTSVLKEEYGASVKPNTSLRLKCDFCDSIIYGKPVIEYIDGVRYYFSGEECARAFKGVVKQSGSKRKGS